MRGRAGGDGDGDVGGGDYHVLQLVRASLSHTHSLFLSLLPLAVSLSVRVQNKSFTTHQKPCSELARGVASLDDFTAGIIRGRRGC